MNRYRGIREEGTLFIRGGMELERWGWGWGGWVGAREMLGTCGEDDVIVTFL